jgi:hypothetical protein
VADFEFVLSLHAAIDGADDGVNSSLQERAILVRYSLHDTIDASYNSSAPQNKRITRSIAFIESRLNHKTISGYRKLQTAKCFQIQTVRITGFLQTAQHTRTTHVGLISQSQQLPAMSKRSTARTKTRLQK